MIKYITLIEKHKYVFLLFGLIQHLFIGIFLRDFRFYAEVIWPINMFILGISSVGIFMGKGKWKNIFSNLLFVLVLVFPVILTVMWFPQRLMMQILSLVYIAFFTFIFIEVIRYLIIPGYINIDIITASACGYFLMIEVSVFLLSYFYYNNPEAFKNIDPRNVATVYTDLVYFSSIIQTTIGFGDITPNTHYTKLAVSLIGIAGHFYTVVLLGILIGKFTSHRK